MITSQDMKELEECSEQVGITRVELMENAGRKVAEFLDDRYLDNLKDKQVLVICGQGNNGGDGFVSARYLHGLCKMDVLFLGNKLSLSEEARINYEHLMDLDRSLIVHFEKDGMHMIDFGKYDIIIDAMIGLGVKGELQYPYSHAVKCINSSKAYIICVDVPSGINADVDGQTESLYVNPSIILTFHDTKPGLKQFADKVKIVDIGIPF
jgi:hydroxyethylthiazole kinase-like uncharacterized protein yjeF